jgi:hypothetical protein
VITIGDRFGHLVVEADLGMQAMPRTQKLRRCWSCRCDCGTTIATRDDRLKAGRATSCGCQGRAGARQAYQSEPIVESPDYMRGLIEARSIPEPMSGCWIWTWSLASFGYGQMRAGGTNRRAHVVAYEAFRGPVPPGLIVRHRCDTPCCVNPDHLLVGTKQDNADDMVKRGRYGPPRRTGAKLSPRQVDDLREAFGSGTPQWALADEYGLDSSQVSRIVNGRSWRR